MLQIVTFTRSHGPDMQDLDCPANSFVTTDIQIGETARTADFHMVAALDATMGEPDRLRDHITDAIGDLVDKVTLAMLIVQIIAIFKVIMLRVEKGEILRAVEDLYGLDGRTIGRIMIETPTWQQRLFRNRGNGDVDAYYRNLVTRHFDGDSSDMQLFMLLADRTPVIRHGMAYGISTDAANSRAILESARDIALPGDLARFTPRLREAADVVTLLARLTHRIVRIHDILKDPDGIEVGTYWMEAPFYIPDPTLPADAWLDVIFNPEAKATDEVA